jgi:uncharacterized repeat protein (TIGR03943 family)
MNPAHQRLASAAAALVWAAVLLYFCISGRINLYLIPGFRNYALLGGLGLALVGLFVLLTHKTPASCGHDHAPGEGHDHESSDMPAWGIIACMVLPILATAWLTNDSFSMRALAHKGAFAEPVKLAPMSKGGVPTRDQLEARPRSEQGAVVMDLLEIYFSSMDPDYAAAMDGMQVEVQARIAAREKTKIAYRLLLTCCAADGRPLSLELEIPEALDVLPDNSWARIGGRISYRKNPTGSLIPVITVSHLAAEKAPAEEYLLRY